MIGLYTKDTSFQNQITQLVHDAGEEICKVAGKEDESGILLLTDSYEKWMEEFEIPIFLFGKRRPKGYPSDIRHLFYRKGNCKREALLRDIGDWYFYLQALEEANQKANHYEALFRKEKGKKEEYEGHLQKGKDLQRYYKRNKTEGTYAIHSQEKSASQVTGDIFLEILWKDQLFFCMGDVTDHGYHAGMIGMYLSGAFESYFRLEREPTLLGLADHLHETLCRLTSKLGQAGDLYCLACLLGVFKENRVYLLNCGGESPIRFSKEEGAKLFSLEENTYPPIGDSCYDGMEKRITSYPISREEGYLFYTDGLTDTFRSSKQRDFQNNFSENLVEDSVRAVCKRSGCCPEQITKAVLGDAESFGMSSKLWEEKAVHRRDDCTVACIYKKEELVIQRTLQADRGTLLSFLKGEVLPKIRKKDRMMMHLVLEELFVNLGSYGFSPGKEKEIRFTLYEGGTYFRFFTEDNGTFFDILAYQPKELEEDAIGGHGIRLIRELVSEIAYRWENQSNCIECRIEKQGE